jgi:hypothetical protein
MQPQMYVEKDILRNCGELAKIGNILVMRAPKKYRLAGRKAFSGQSATGVMGNPPYRRCGMALFGW